MDLFSKDNLDQMSFSNIDDRIAEVQAEVEEIKVQEGRHQTVHRYVCMHACMHLRIYVYPIHLRIYVYPIQLCIYQSISARMLSMMYDCPPYYSFSRSLIHFHIYSCTLAMPAYILGHLVI